ncbi:hypothetical protein Q7P37_008984 [Cladosporium fusiforme]
MPVSINITLPFTSTHNAQASQDAQHPTTMRTKSRPPHSKQAQPANFDEVKRRFIRQNRELAKNNSTQSLRIRSLELEVSRLLQTNLELREELLRSRNAEHDAKKQSTTEGVRGFKAEMMAKLKELSGIVDGIEESKADDSAEMEKEERRMSVLSQMEFRERQPLADLMRECQMPTIDETKSHPRRTLEPEEIKIVRLSDGSSNESPDLGPPPVARFDCQDPIKFDARVEERQLDAPDHRQEPEEKTPEEDMPAALSVNLETRRKRKDSQPKIELRRHSILPPPSPSTSESEVTAPTLRTGAKRKLADRDLENTSKAPTKTDFTFSRKSSIDATNHAVETAAEPEKGPDTVEISAPAPPSARRVLGDKSVNMSPRKATASPEKAGKGDLKKPSQPKFGAAKDRSTTRRSRLSAIPLPPPEQEVSVATVELPASNGHSEAPQDLAPKTPAALDLFSPPPSESSVSTTHRTGTPPPMGLVDSTAEATRPSRRARSAVNYAEPSLNAKMRRQEKSMMDAVTGLKHHRLAMGASAERKARNVVVKEEPRDEDAWKTLPEVNETALSSAGARAASPLDSRSGEATSLDSLVNPETNDHLANDTAEHKQKLTTSLPTIQRPRVRPTAIGSSKSQVSDSDATEADADLDSAARRLQELDLYDFKDKSSSSPASTGATDGTPSSSSTAAKPSAAAPRTNRRHSSISKGDTARVPTARSAAPAAASSRRRSMMT